MGSYDNGIYQPIFSIIAKNANEEQKEEFLSVIRNVLEDCVKNGISKKSLLAGINSMEFKNSVRQILELIRKDSCTVCSASTAGSMMKKRTVYAYRSDRDLCIFKKSRPKEDISRNWYRNIF